MESVSQRDFSQIMTESISWSYESKENFFSIIIPLITVIATKKMSEISIIPTLLIAAGSFAWYRLYLNNQSSNEVKEKKIQEGNLVNAYNYLTTFLPLDYTEMQKTFMGYKSNDKGEKINQEYYSPRMKRIIEVCNTLGLDPQSVENVWKSFPEKVIDSQDQFHDRCAMLLGIMPNEIREHASDKSE